MSQLSTNTEEKQAVFEFWNQGSCGEVYAVGSSLREQYETHAKARYQLEPYILELARFEEGKDRDVLEIGVGMGADHLEWAKSGPRSLTGVDLTPRAVEHTTKRLQTFGFQPNLQVADAETLPFKDNSFDIVYSWGVLHVTPDTQKAIHEVHRVLRPGGKARILLYHRWSLVGYMLWVRYALLTGHPGRSLDEIYSKYLESPGTKAYTVSEAKELFARFREAQVQVRLCFGDLLEGEAGQRHRGILLTVARKLWPRFFIRRFLKNHGLELFIEATK